jgi:protein-S-isoprenylcysteine O-methyltransferase Ste14
MSTGLTLAVVYTLGWAPLFFIRTESLTAAFPLYSRAERWSTVGSAVLLGVYVTLTCVTVSLEQAVRWSAAAASLVVFAIGVILWLRARIQIGPVHVRRLPDQPPPSLRRDGAFGLVRNPLYLGVLIAAGAPLIVTPRLWLVLLYAACALALVIRTLQEERRLRVLLGAEHARYCAEVRWRLFPFIW